MQVLFREEQKFNQWWIWVLLIGLTLIPVYGLYKQIYREEAFGNNPLPNFGLIILLIFMLFFVGLFWMMRLKTVIDDTSISVRFLPFINKTISWSDVRSAEVVDYGFVGGWGIRLGTKYGTVYNTSGNMGLALELNNGKRLCIGTQKPDELKKLLQETGR